MSIQIITDSTCDLPKKLIEEYNIHVIPLNIHFGEKVYKDGIDLTAENFYQLLESSDQHHPTTSQPSPGDFMNLYKKVASSGDDIISIHISSELSGTYQSAVLANNMISESEEDINIYTVDSRITSTSLGMMVLEAAKMADKDEDINSILKRIDELKNKIKTYFMVDTLEYLEKGGRIGKAQALVGNLLNVKPILALEEGIVVPQKKVRGRKKGLNYIIELIEKEFTDEKVNVAIMHANTPDEIEKLENNVKERIDYNEKIVSELGPIVGTHAGPGTVGIAIYAV
ncbi:DegV family protein [Natranaerofaba carboxydovora]|uniref:DegV family protein n=1 Tax=Natranaerofaba carboxydovora TaxID=2742683 RepID=UPI001F1291E2|nr:DegV family protein [Natranaerofaba carboxydovora]UMZ73310.1 DegV domain-containing protein [Natranaerofaba carboxydovora]